MTLTFQGPVTSSVTWLFYSRCPFRMGGPLDPSLSLTVSEIFRPKHHVLIDTMLNRHCACAYHVTCTLYVKLKYIFQFLTPTLPIYYATFIGLRWRIRGVLSVTSNVKGQIEPWRSGGMKSCNFYCKRHILAWIHVDWAIFRENRLRGLTSRLWGKKT